MTMLLTEENIGQIDGEPRNKSCGGRQSHKPTEMIALESAAPKPIRTTHLKTVSDPLEIFINARRTKEDCRRL